MLNQGHGSRDHRVSVVLDKSGKVVDPDKIGADVFGSGRKGVHHLSGFGIQIQEDAGIVNSVDGIMDQT